MSPPAEQQISKLLLQTYKATSEDNSEAKNIQAGREQVSRKASFSARPRHRLTWQQVRVCGTCECQSAAAWKGVRESSVWSQG